MKEKIINYLCDKFSKENNLIKIMLENVIFDGYNMLEAEKIIDDFYNCKSMQ